MIELPSIEPEPRVVTVWMQFLAWILVVAVSSALGMATIGMFFGLWVPLTWMIILGILSVSFVGVNDGGDIDEDLVTP